MKKIELGFISALVLFSLVIIASALWIEKLNYKTAAIPVAATIIIVGLIALDLTCGRRQIREALNEEKERGKTPFQFQQSIFLVLLWLILTTAVFYLFGFIIGSFVSSLVYFRIYVYSQWLKAGIISVAMAAAIYLMFDLLAGFNLYPGLITRMIF